MIVCQGCHERDAVVHLTEVVADQVTTVHLCGRCAAERGIASDAAANATPLGGFLAGLSPTAGLGEGASGSVCPECGATLADIQASGRMGCPTCWVVFERPLRHLVRRLHGATQHSGDDDGASGGTADDPAELDRRRALNRLQRELRSAIAAEEFEQAAVLRDQLKALENSVDP